LALDHDYAGLQASVRISEKLRDGGINHRLAIFRAKDFGEMTAEKVKQVQSKPVNSIEQLEEEYPWF
jgi:hypothetical protein